jgi:GNAT superfamily N-acetyltransferase
LTGSKNVHFREIDASPAGLAELTRFYRRSYVREFPDADERESLANMKRYLRLKAQSWYGRNNYHIVLAELGGEPIGGSVFDYLAAPNAGIIEFLFIGAAHRLKGLGRSLLDETARILERDAREAAAQPLAAIVAEMNDPFRPGTTPDNLDPFERCAIWGKWGFCKMQFPYVQPALSRRQQPVDGLALIAKLADGLAPDAVGASWILSVVAEYMRWAMRIDEPARNPQYQEMERFLGSGARIPLIPLQAYVGRDPSKLLHVREVRASDDSFRPVLDLLSAAIKERSHVASARQFRAALSDRSRGRSRYHLWSLHHDASAPPDGMASFFAMRPAGFGGYIVLGGSLRGKGLLRGLVARIEEAMIRDAPGAKGWFIECGDESVAPFLNTGFHEVPLAYRPPALGNRKKSAERLRLLYKPFGVMYEPPRLPRRFVLGAISAILKRVYGVTAPRSHRCYVRARASLRPRLQTKKPGALSRPGSFV